MARCPAAPAGAVAGLAAAARPALAAAAWLLQRGADGTERVGVAVADVENATGDPELDGLSGLLSTVARAVPAPRRGAADTPPRRDGRRRRRRGCPGAGRRRRGAGARAGAPGPGRVLAPAVRADGAGLALEVRRPLHRDRSAALHAGGARRREGRGLRRPRPALPRHAPGAAGARRRRRRLRHPARRRGDEQPARLPALRRQPAVHVPHLLRTGLRGAPREGAGRRSHVRARPLPAGGLARPPRRLARGAAPRHRGRLPPHRPRSAQGAATSSAPGWPTSTGATTRRWPISPAWWSTNPSDEEGIYEAGDLLYHRSEFDRAAPWFERQLQLDPQLAHGWGLEHLAHSLGALGRREDLRRLADGWSAGPANAVNLHALATALAWLGDLPGAAAAAGREAEAGGGLSALQDQAYVAITAGRYDEVREGARAPRSAGKPGAGVRVPRARGDRRLPGEACRRAKPARRDDA